MNTITELPRIGLDDLNTIPQHGEITDRPRHSWTPQSLIRLAAHPPAPPTIGNILYPGKRTLLSGETESLKTWLALILAKAEMELELPVAWVDLDDMGAGDLLNRLRTLQVPDNTINNFFLYYQPDEQLKGQALQDVLMQLTVTGTRLMIIDAFTGALHLHGLSPDKAPEIETFWKEVADPIAKTGTAPVLIDHVVKNADTRGKYSTGSERKASGAQVHIGAHLLTPLSIGTTGRAILTVHKDRPAYLPRPTLGILELTSDGHTISYKLERDRSHDGGLFRPTVLMEKVSRWLEQQTEAVSMKHLEESITGKRDAIRTAVTTLHQDGHINQEQGPRNTRLITTQKPYREADEPPQDDLAPTSPHLAPKLGPFGASTTSPPPSSLTGEGEVVGAQTQNGATSPPAFLAPDQNGHAEAVPLELILDTQPSPEPDPRAGWFED